MNSKRKAWEAQQDYIAKQEDYIRRVHYGQLHKQPSRGERHWTSWNLLSGQPSIESPHMHFGEVRRSGEVVLQVDNLTKCLRPAAVLRT